MKYTIILVLLFSTAAYFQSQEKLSDFAVGFNEIDGKSFSFLDEELNNVRIVGMGEDNQNRLWFVGLKGAYRYENNNFINVNRNGPW